MTDGVDWSQYTKIVLDPVVIYAGSDQQFGDTSAEDKKALADYLQAQFAKAIETKYALATKPDSAALHIRVTLTGIETSIPVLSTLTKITPVGLVVNSVQTARDKQGRMTGSVSYAVEIYDGLSDRLLRAYVAKQYPWAADVSASFGTLDASRSGIRIGADDLLTRLH